MRIEAKADSDVGRKRDQNEDCHLIDESLGLYMVCDGMGGHAAGEVAASNASRITAATIRSRREEIAAEIDQPGGHFKVVQIVDDAVRESCRQLYAMARSDGDCAGMGTTLTMLLIRKSKAILAHVGDSRLYLLRNGELHLLSNDHTLAEQFAKESSKALDPEIYKKFSNVLTRSLGPHEAVEVETLLFDVLPGDRFLICSDGLSNYFRENDEVIRLLSDDDFDQIPERLTDLANQRGGGDNITSVVLRATSNEPAPSHSSGRYLESLNKSFLFSGLSLNRLMRLINISKVESFGEDEVIIRKGDPRTGLYIVVDGSCRLAVPDGTTKELAPGDCFGETALALDGDFLIEVQSKSEVQLLHISRDAFHQLTRRLPRLGRKLLNNLLNHVSRQLEEIQQVS